MWKHLYLHVAMFPHFENALLFFTDFLHRLWEHSVNDNNLPKTKLERVVLVQLILIFFNDPRLIRRIVRGVPNVQEQIKLNNRDVST